MTNQSETDSQLPPSQPPRPKRIALRPVTIILFLTLNLLLLMIFGWPYFQTRFNFPEYTPWGLKSDFSPTHTLDSAVAVSEKTPTPKSSLIPTQSMVSEMEPSPLLENNQGLWKPGMIVLSMRDGLDTHLFLYQPLSSYRGPVVPLTRLTDGQWDDITPALNPGDDRLVFSSNRGGQWDLYSLDLENGGTTQLTDTSEYEASPSWSPDGLWMTYEQQFEDSLDIFIQPIDGSQDAIRLTTHLAADFSPTWSPLGRQIAFVSTREGRNQIWLANLDETGENRFVKLSSHYEVSANHPVWSPDGRYLAWTALTDDGFHNVYIWDRTDPGKLPIESGSGDWAVWSPDGQALLTVLRTPTQSYLTAYSLNPTGIVILPPILLPGAVSGLAWTDAAFSSFLPIADYPSPTPVWKLDIDVDSETVGGRWKLIPLNDVEAPYPRLHDRVDEAFQAFRSELAQQVGWDLLATLNNAYIPLSSALTPGFLEDWLYTGRAFTYNTLPINAGWMAVIREDFGQQVFWRVFLRARFQDGSQGKPMHDLPWDFNARYSGQPLPYDQGGEVASAVPPGYWVDMTQLAASYGWARLPALSNWKAVYPGARFNEYVRTDGLDWESAMLEIYPGEVLLTLTPVHTATVSPTTAPLWYQSPTPVPSLTATGTPTFVPTLTPTHEPTLGTTVSPSSSPSPTFTKTPTP